MHHRKTTIAWSAIATTARRSPTSSAAPICAVLGKYAIGKPPADSTGINLPVLLRAITKVLGWRLRGRAWPNPFFQPNTREPAYPIAVLAEAQRETLRPLCGPKPAAL